MQDHQDKKQQAKEIEQDLNKGLSRRAFLDRLSAIGVGFGAAFVFGVNRSEAGVPADALVNLKSTNPVLNDIVQDSQQNQLPDGTDQEARVQLAQYPRVGYRRVSYPRVDYRRVSYPRVVYPRVRVPYARLRVPYARFPYRRIL
jgi:hypothetical protein